MTTGEVGGEHPRVRSVLIPRLAVALGVPEVLVTHDLDLATLGLSSLEIMEIVYDAEDALEVVFPEAALESVTTVGQLVAALTAEVEQHAR